MNYSPSGLHAWILMESFTDCSASILSFWGAVMLGILIGWIWKPKWVSTVASKIKPCDLWSDRFNFRGSWTSLSTLLIPPNSKVRCAKCSSMLLVPSTDVSDKGVSEESIVQKTPVSHASSVVSYASSVVGERDLLELHRSLHGMEGGLPWEMMMERSAPGITYQAWRRDPQDGPTEYKSRTIFEDSTPELVKDFYWDDSFRSVWDDMLIYFKTLEDCVGTGADIAHWVRKFPLFCSDREYLLGRRIFEVEGTFYCITKATPYAAVPRRDRPLRVDTYYSSWCIRAAESTRVKGQMNASEVMFFHAEDMHIPKKIQKFAVRQGMWACVRKMEPGLRKYQAHRSTAKMLSQSARLAQSYTRMPPNFFEVSDLIAPPREYPEDGGGENGGGEAAGSVDEVVKNGEAQLNGGLKWLIVGGAVVLALTLDRGVLGRTLVIGLARKFGGVNRRLP